MSWDGRTGVISSIGLSVGRSEPIRLLTGSEGVTTLLIGESIDIGLRDVHVRALLDQVPRALADRAYYDQTDVTITAAADACDNAEDLLDSVLAQARKAAEAGAKEKAAKARAAAEAARASVGRLGGLIDALGEAMVQADSDLGDAARAGQVAEIAAGG